LADLDQAIALDPKSVAALIERAQLRVARHERAPALADLDAAPQAVAGPAMERLKIAGLYDALEAPEGAIVQYDSWIPAHREDARLAQALNGRCWSRALAGRDLDKALGDCDAALRLRQHTPAFLDSRGLVRLRMGDWDRAIADYDESLKLAPKSAWSLFGRGIAKRHKGLTAEAQEDIDDAVAIMPGLAARAKRAGIS
jgi:tetratricopeptide (TPR) repeat protein